MLDNCLLCYSAGGSGMPKVFKQLLEDIANQGRLKMFVVSDHDSEGFKFASRLNDAKFLTPKPSQVGSFTDSVNIPLQVKVVSGSLSTRTKCRF